jgi:hypothetical protein
MNGYNRVTANGKALTVARVVAEAFIPNPDNHTIVSHINGNKLDDSADNLKWTTKQDAVKNHDKEISHPRRVIQKDDKGNVIAIHDSVTAAGDAIGMSRHAINKVCTGKNKTAGGFFFEYEDKEFEAKEFDGSGIPIDGFPNYYVYKDGRVYNKGRKGFLKPCENANGYEYVTLCKKITEDNPNDKPKQNHYVHVLVASHFLQKDKGETQVNHKDYNRRNNHVDNLEWCTRAENIKHSKARVKDCIDTSGCCIEHCGI